MSTGSDFASYFTAPLAGALAYILSTWPSSGMAQPLDLVVTTYNPYAETAYDRDALRNMPSVDVTTSTPWTDGISSFRGVPLAALVGTQNGPFEMELSAINNYMVTMPSDVMTPRYPIVAYEMNGAPMSVRDKGPFWLIFPYDDQPEYQTERTYSRSIWQLIHIRILQ